MAQRQLTPNKFNFQPGDFNSNFNQATGVFQTMDPALIPLYQPSNISGMHVQSVLKPSNFSTINVQIDNTTPHSQRERSSRCASKSPIDHRGHYIQNENRETGYGAVNNKYHDKLQLLQEENQQLRNRVQRLQSQIEINTKYLQERDILIEKNNAIEEELCLHQNRMFRIEDQINLWQEEILKMKLREQELEVLNSNFSRMLESEKNNSLILQNLLAASNQEIKNLKNYLDLKENAVSEFEKKVYELKDQIIILRDESENKDHEREMWHGKFLVLERNYAIEIERMKDQMEMSRKALIENEVKGISLKWEKVVGELNEELEDLRANKYIEHKTNLLCNENDILREKIQEYSAELEVWEKKYAITERKYEETLKLNEIANFEIRSLQEKEKENSQNCGLQKLVSSLQLHKTQIENKLQDLEQSNDKLKELLKQKDDEFNSLKGSIKGLQDAQERHISELKLTHDYELKSLADRQRRELDSKITEERRSCELRLKAVVDELEALKQEKNFSDKDRDSLRECLNERNQQLDQIKREKLEKEAQQSKKIEELSASNECLSFDVDEKRRKIANLEEKLLQKLGTHNPNYKDIQKDCCENSQDGFKESHDDIMAQDQLVKENAALREKIEKKKSKNKNLKAIIESKQKEKEEELNSIQTQLENARDQLKFLHNEMENKQKELQEGDMNGFHFGEEDFLGRNRRAGQAKSGNFSPNSFEALAFSSFTNVNGFLEPNYINLEDGNPTDDNKFLMKDIHLLKTQLAAIENQSRTKNGLQLVKIEELKTSLDTFIKLIDQKIELTGKLQYKPFEDEKEHKVEDLQKEQEYSTEHSAEEGRI